MPYQIFLRIFGFVFQLNPTGFHDTVIFLAEVVGEAVQLQLTGLHMTVFVEVVPFIFDDLPSGYDGFSVFSEVVPVSIRGVIVPFIFIGNADPLIINAFAMRIYIVFVHHGGAGNDTVFV